MEVDEEQTEIKRLEPLIGEWSIEADFPGAPAPSGGSGARIVFESMAGERFLLQRWQVPVPEAPDGIAIIGPDPERAGYLQHYFDSRGVARIYEMSFADGVWKLSRTKGDHSPLDFCQRFEGSFDEEARTIAGRWEISHDGSSWEHDFNLTYRKLA